MKVAAVLFALVSGAALGQQASDLLAPGGIIPLKLDHASELFHQCSRSAPTPTSNLWLPTVQDIAALEAQLPSFIADRETRGLRNPPRTVQYLRQYVGFDRNGNKLIYGSYLPVAPEGRAARRDGSAVIVCDGGPLFWGVVYNTATKRFEEPQFNGPF